MSCGADTVIRAQGKARVFQSLPRHLRRRAASHNPKRVPKRLRRKAAQEVSPCILYLPITPELKRKLRADRAD